jgi:hypothetical protein
MIAMYASRGGTLNGTRYHYYHYHRPPKYMTWRRWSLYHKSTSENGSASYLHSGRKGSRLLWSLALESIDLCPGITCLRVNVF